MKVIIIDDEKQAIASLEMELKEIKPVIKIIGTANSIETGVALLNKTTPDILFLDIRLKDGLGFEILEKINNFGKFRIVFTTAYDQYAIEAFRFGAFDYLLKPIDLDDLQQTISRIHKNKKDYSIPTEELDKMVSFTKVISSEAKIALNTSNGIFIKKISKIIYIQADSNYTKFFFEGIKRPMLISRTLKDFDEILNNAGFVRIHYSYLINLNHLESYHTKDGCYVIMSNQDIIPVSSRKKSNLLETLKQKNGFINL